MDIQSPRVSAPPRPATSSAPEPTIVRPTVSSRPATMEYTRPRPDDPSAPRFTPDNDQAKVQQMASYSQQNQKPKKSKKGLVIGLILFLLLAGGAAGGAYYYFMVMNKQEAAVVEEPAPQPAPAEEGITATPEGVDKTIQSIDQSLNSVNDDQDYSPNDVSDDSLGL